MYKYLNLASELSESDGIIFFVDKHGFNVYSFSLFCNQLFRISWYIVKNVIFTVYYVYIVSLS